MDKNTHRFLVILLLSIITTIQLISCMCADAVMTDTKEIRQEVKTIRDILMAGK